ILICVFFLKIIMLGFSQSSASSQTSRGIKKKWVPEEDATLVSCMVDLHNVGTFNADMRFKAIIYDMLSGKDNSSFGWDKHR
ncbi:hypothetical protein Gotur_018572, partial [Gossypium turneri]